MEGLEAVIREIEQTFKLKGTTDVGDVVLILAENPLTMLYGLVTSIEPDMSRKDQWWHLGMQILSFPPQKVIWTLRESQFTGMEIFSMGGEKRFIKSLDFIEGKEELDGATPEAKEKPVLRRVK